MENIPAVSVIIPMYNVEKYIGECLDSLLNQTMTDFEVVLVNDCSTDNSHQVAETYLEKFGGRMKIYDNRKNSGVSAARNNGLLKASGKYIYFMDSDDLLLLTGLEKMYKTAEKFDVDFVNLSAFYLMNEDATEIEKVSHMTKRIFGSVEDEIFIDDDLNQRLQKPLNYRFYGSAVLRLFRRDFLIKNKIFFPENVKRAEDAVWKYGIFFFAKKIAHVKFAVYFYRMSENSKTRTRRTVAQYINSRMTTIIDGIKWIDDVMERVDFFKQNPEYRYKILEEFSNDLFHRLLVHSRKKGWSAFHIYNAIKRGFGKKLGKYDVLVAELCSYIDDQKKEIANLSEQLKGN